MTADHAPLSAEVGRLREFLAQRDAMRGIDQEHIMGANHAPLYRSDIEALLATVEQQAEALGRVPSCLWHGHGAYPDTCWWCGLNRAALHPDPSEGCGCPPGRCLGQAPRPQDCAIEQQRDPSEADSR